MAMINCGECGKEISDQAAACPNCGAPAKKTDMIFCTKCGAEVVKEAIVCPRCGVPTSNYHQQQNYQQPQQAPVYVNVSNVNTNSNVNSMYGGRGGTPKNKWVALCLCFFLGYLGAHKFYEGKMGMGILYLFTGGLFGIGVIINFIGILLKPNPYYV